MINHLHLPSRQSRRAVRTCLFSANAARTTSARESGQEAALELVAGAVTREIINMKCTLTNSLATSRVKA
jgi:hypothetical protein